jgi:hypothetical protein
MESRFIFLIFAGLLPLALAGMVAPQMADLYRAGCLGSGASVAGWIFAGIWWLILPRAVPETLTAAPAISPQLGAYEEPEPEEGLEETPEEPLPAVPEVVESKEPPADELAAGEKAQG